MKEKKKHKRERLKIKDIKINPGEKVERLKKRERDRERQKSLTLRWQKKQKKRSAFPCTQYATFFGIESRFIWTHTHKSVLVINDRVTKARQGQGRLCQPGRQKKQEEKKEARRPVIGGWRDFPR